MAAKEAEVLAKLDDGQAARNLPELLALRTARWLRRERRRPLLAASIGSGVLVALSTVWLWLLDRQLGSQKQGLVDVRATFDRWLAGLDMGTITWTWLDTWVALGAAGVVGGLGWWLVAVLWHAGRWAIAVTEWVVSEQSHEDVLRELQRQRDDDVARQAARNIEDTAG